MEDELINNEVPVQGSAEDNEDQNEILENLTKQLSYLNDKFKVYENITSYSSKKDKETEQFKSDDRGESENTNNNYLKRKLIERDDLMNKLREDYSQSQINYERKLREKEIIIKNLRRELDLIKCERNENINQMQNIFKNAEGGRNKLAIFNMRAGGMHSHQSSMTSMSSLSTYHDDKQYEKLTNEKISIEKQLVEYKYKYAENSAKLNELEGEFEKLHRKCIDLTDKLKVKDNLLKKVTEERDHYKFNTSTHYSANSCILELSKAKAKKKESQMIVVDNKTSQDNIQIFENYINTEPSRDIRSESHSKCNSPSSAKSGSIIKYLKNIFKSGK